MKIIRYNVMEYFEIVTFTYGEIKYFMYVSKHMDSKISYVEKLIKDNVLF